MGCSVLSVSSMSDDESSPGSAVAASEDSDRVETLISKFEEFFTGEVKETFERLEV